MMIMRSRHRFVGKFVSALLSDDKDQVLIGFHVWSYLRSPEALTTEKVIAAVIAWLLLVVCSDGCACEDV
jgi:hypothetical protein